MEGEKLAEIFGVKGGSKIDLFRSGITDLVIEYGAASVKPNDKGSNLEAWLSLRYQY